MVKRKIDWINILKIVVIILITITLVFIGENIYECYQTDPKIDTLMDKIKPLFTKDNHFEGLLEPLNNRDILKEIKVMKGEKSYTINKQKVYLCLKDEKGEYYDDNMLVYVLLHEFSHIFCSEIGHTQKFHDIFQEVLDYAIKKGVYDPSKPLITNYCTYNDNK
jgi:hypothetical protein